MKRELMHKTTLSIMLVTVLLSLWLYNFPLGFIASFLIATIWVLLDKLLPTIWKNNQTITNKRLKILSTCNLAIQLLTFCFIFVQLLIFLFLF